MILKKNTAGQTIYFGLPKLDGSVVTGITVIGYTSIDGGAQSSVSGTLTELGNGQFCYAPTQAETNGTYIGFWFTAPTYGVLAQSVFCQTTGADLTDGNALGLAVLPSGGQVPGAAGGLAIVGSEMDLVNAPNSTGLAALAAAILDLANGVDTGMTMRGLFKLLSSLAVGKGAGTVANPFRDVNDTKNRIAATIVAGVRTAVTTDAT